MTVIRNSIARLKRGEQGESAAQVNGHSVQFTRVSVGDANNALPAENPDRTSLDNHVTDGEIVSHKLDPDNDTQRILQLRIGPDANYDARELLIYATANGIEFPHSYVRLGSAYPVRTAENGGVQILIDAIIKVSSETDFNITVRPATDYISRSEFNGHLHEQYLEKTDYITSLPFKPEGPITVFNRYSLKAAEFTAPITRKDETQLQDGDWFSVRASSGVPILKIAETEAIKFKRLEDGAVDVQVNIVADDKNERVFVYNAADNVWEF